MKHRLRKVILFFAVTILCFGVLKPLLTGAKGERWGIGRFLGESPVEGRLDPINSNLMSKLAICESGGNPKAINWEDGGSPSFGKYQYKLGTFTGFVRKLKMFPATEDVEMMNIIMDEDVQDSVTSKVLEDPHNWWHWTNCFKSMGKLV